MREKTLNKIMIGLAVAIGVLIILFVVGILQEKSNSRETNTNTTVTETTEGRDDEEDVSDADDEEESETVTDNDSEETSGKVVFDEEEDYILPESDSKYYSKSELSELTAKQLAIARNEIYAKHGYIFSKNKEMKEYFEGKSWYKGTTKSADFHESVFNKYEKENIDTIVELEGK
ncbi:MAG: YARHG domain-containing protein [Lachnospiraceae bacterium]|nr:YARHG domain-containing protein [Lachnospiraceae bacterium]